MNNVLQTLGYDNPSSFKDKITTTLSVYTEKIIESNGVVKYHTVNNDYFLKNDTWRMDFFGSIPQFKKQVDNYKFSSKNITFLFDNPSITLEMKFIVYSKLFSDAWKLSFCMGGQQQYIKRLTTFMNEKYPKLNSFLDLDIDKANLQWMDWLNQQGVKTMTTQTFVDTEYTHKTAIVNFLNSIYTTLFTLTDEREEWEKDIWDVRNLEKYGITYNKSRTHYYIDFTAIINETIRVEVKRYVKQRLVSNNQFSWSTARSYLKFLSLFINKLCELEPTWNDLKGLERHHIETYIEWLHAYVKGRITQKNAHPEKYILESLSTLGKFLSDIQLREYAIAPKKNVRILIFPEDKPTVKKKPYDQIDYVPDHILEQLFEHINELPKRYVPVIWVMYKTGLRISDVLGLTHDCLVRLNGAYWVVTDIEKVYVEGHRIPIDDELANMIAILIQQSKEQSNQDNNPDNYIFNCYTGKRKGKPYGQNKIQESLNTLAVKYKITDEMGNRFHFKNHAFRHTYAIKMLNGGADILTVQELLAHASPEMTLRYAKLLDDTKRKAFEKVHKTGIFSFQVGNELVLENTDEIPEDIRSMLWTNHKLNAIDTPYGTCLQRTNGKCQFAKQPPCLTCNGGNPCKDLCVGAFEGDVKKYEILISSTKAMIENAKMYNRVDMLKENEELLKLYEDIYAKIIEGNIIYSKLNRLKKGDTNDKL